MVGPVKLTTAAVSTTTTTAVGETAVVSTGLMAHFHTYIYYIFIYTLHLRIEAKSGYDKYLGCDAQKTDQQSTTTKPQVELKLRD